MRKNTNALHTEEDREAAARHRKRTNPVDNEAFVKKLQEYLDRRVSEISAHNAADAGKNEQLIAALGDRIHQEVISLAEAGRREAEERLKDFGERIEWQISTSLKHQEKASEELAAGLAQAIKEQAAKLGEIDRLVGTLGQRVDGLIANLAEAERANSGIRTALIGSLENTVAALAEKARADSQLFVQNLESSRLQLTELMRAEAAKTATLIASVEEKIAANAEKSRVDAETLARTFQVSLQQVAEAARAQTEQAAERVCSLEAKIAALADETEAKTSSLAQRLSEQIETATRRFMDSAQAEAAKTAASIESLAQMISTTAESGQAQVTTLAKALGQKLERHAREIAEKARAEAVGMASRIEALAKQVAESGELSRAEAAKATAELEEKIAALAGRIKVDSELLAQSLGQQIERQAQLLAEQTDAGAARTAAVVESLERQVTSLAEKAKAHSESLMGVLGQEIAGHVLHLADNTRAATAKTLDLLGALEDRVAAAAVQSRSDSESLGRTLREDIERATRELVENTRAETAATGALLESKIVSLSAQVQADTEAVANNLMQHLEISTRRLAEGMQAESAKTATLIGLLEARVAAMAETTSAEQAALGQSLSRQLEDRALRIAEKVETASAAASALLADKISALAESGRTDVAALRQALGEKIEVHVRELIETTRAETAKATALLESKIAAAAERSRADTEATAKAVAEQIDTRARELVAATQAEAAGTAALIRSLQASVASAAERSQTEAESLRQDLNRVEAHAVELAQSMQAELTAKVANTGGVLGERIDTLAKDVKLASESLLRTLGQQIETSARELAESTRVEAAQTKQLLETRIAALADKGQAATEFLARTLGEQIKGESLALSQELKAEVAKGTALFENRISALSEESRAGIRGLAHTLGGQIEAQGRELAELARAETAKASAFLAERIAAAGQESRAEAAAIAKNLRDQIDDHVHKLAEGARMDAAKTVALITSLEEKVAAFAEKNRIALELQAKALAAELNTHLAELSEASRVHQAEITNLLDTGLKGIEHSVAVSGETSRAQFQSQFKAIDEQFHRRLEDLAQRDVAKTEALAEALRHKIDLGIVALLEGTRAESAALESVLRTLVEQLGRKLGAFTETFRSETEASHKKIDGLRGSIDRQLEHLSLLAPLGEPIERIDGTETAAGATLAEARPFRQPDANGELPVASAVGPSRGFDPVGLLAPQDGESFTQCAPEAPLGAAVEASGVALVPSNGVNGPIDVQRDGISDSLHADDPFDPIVAAPQATLVVDDESSGQGPRPGYARRWFGFRRAKY